MHTPSGQCCVHLYARILSTSFSSVSIFSAWCYSSVSISMHPLPPPHPLTLYRQIYRQRSMVVGRTVRSSTCAKIEVEGMVFVFFSIKFRPFTPFDPRSGIRLKSSIRPICKCQCTPQVNGSWQAHTVAWGRCGKHSQRPSLMYFQSAEPIRVFSLALISLKSWHGFVMC